MTNNQDNYQKKNIIRRTTKRQQKETSQVRRNRKYI